MNDGKDDIGRFIDELVKEPLAEEERIDKERAVSEELDAAENVEVVEGYTKVGEGLYRMDAGWVDGKKLVCSVPGCSSAIMPGRSECEAHTKARWQLLALKSGVKVTVNGHIPESPEEIRHMTIRRYRASVHWMLTKDLYTIVQGNLCADCGRPLGKDRFLHHFVYRYDSDGYPAPGFEEFHHMGVVCGGCHLLDHGLDETAMSDEAVMVASLGEVLKINKEVTDG